MLWTLESEVWLLPSDFSPKLTMHIRVAFRVWAARGDRPPLGMCTFQVTRYDAGVSTSVLSAPRQVRGLVQWAPG